MIWQDLCSFTFIAPSFFLRLRFYPGCSYVLMQSKFLGHSVILRVTFIISLRPEVATNWHDFWAKVNDMSLTMLNHQHVHHKWTFLWVYFLYLVDPCSNLWYWENVNQSIFPRQTFGGCLFFWHPTLLQDPRTPTNMWRLGSCWVDESDGLVMIKKMHLIPLMRENMW